MEDRRGEAGKVRLGCILLLTVSLLFGLPMLFIAWKAMPVKAAVSELYDFIVAQAKEATATPTELIEERITSKAAELGLPVNPRSVSAKKTVDKIRIRAAFSVPLEFPGYTYDWNFDLQVERPYLIK